MGIIYKLLTLQRPSLIVGVAAFQFSWRLTARDPLTEGIVAVVVWGQDMQECFVDMWSMCYILMYCPVGVLAIFDPRGIVIVKMKEI